jgi:hypothetical protein
MIFNFCQSGPAVSYIDKNPKRKKREERQKRPGVRREKEPTGIGREAMTAILQNGRRQRKKRSTKGKLRYNRQNVTTCE